ncbi:MAG: Diaminopimelate decarboxylase [uncultured Thermoleophilia bacterium]|uniref:Diaminopimelate decarboxylase n=1 Tax=uncultured Thermoleophilia bacterium TaxID=1497501 RepID=A0A6J4UMB1_9ACTN|nr:MAG: Diaminopimelate decarboxylase [uncultured Thermoleophilia bacterium]
MSASSLELFPDGTGLEDGALTVGGVRADALADRFGTPLYVYDAATLHRRARAYVEPLDDAPGGGRAVFALKANPVPAVLRELRRAGMGADVASAGELAAARLAGFEGSELVVHGNAKSGEDLEAALDARAALVVLDVAEEATDLARRAAERGVRQDVLVRVTPDIAVDTHAKIRTGQAGSKFGLGPADVAALVPTLPGALTFRGLHVHLGSQVVDADTLGSTAAWCARFAADHDLSPEVLDLGGGLGVAYRCGDPSPDPRAYAAAVVASVVRAFAEVGRPVPELVLEPGRSVVAPAGVTLYRILTVKRSAGTTWVAVDGGMGDNLRVALYDTAYAPVLAGRPTATPDGRYDLCGHHCESGDVLAHDVGLAAPRPGDVVAVPVTGAYHQSLATPYNLFGRPAAVLVDGGEARLATRRETVEDLLRREVLDPRPAGSGAACAQSPPRTPTATRP